MRKFHKTRRAVAVATATLALAVSGAVAASPASATTTGGGCRGGGNNDDAEHPTGSWAKEPAGVLLLPCVNDDGNGYIRPAIYFNGGSQSIFPCFQLIKVGYGQVHDFGCEPGEWVPASSGYNPNTGDYQEWGNGVIVAPGPGEFVVQEGFWSTINGVYGYYGNAQSWPIWIS
ncbi:hypothetical protein LN042_08780 [Kitasatospora sp. RB6PN24]|uniref:hypothetical protein n=1 Tax=Kitasatospora humi TaxID=2893891 RepID=UPI001E4DFC4F|nr:hypothetical protein [Kitasatospora humi]MCC9307194.1 hypothetical protein [Kitasatospora humi]